MVAAMMARGASSLGVLVLLALAANAIPPTRAFAALDDPDLDGLPGVREAPAEPQAAIPSVLVSTGSLLIDRSHGNNFDVSGFTNYLASQGWLIAQHSSGPVTEAVLAGYDILMVPISISWDYILPFSSPEISAIQSYLVQGGGLWVLHDSQDPSGVNTLSSTFGVVFRYDVIRDPTNNEGQVFWPTVHLLTPHAVTAGVGDYGYYGGACLSVATPASTLCRADEDAYSLYCPAGTYPPTLAVWEGAGRVVFAGDNTPLHPSYYPGLLRPEEQLLLQNIANWLLGAPPTATSSSTWGMIKGLYAGPRSVSGGLTDSR